MDSNMADANAVLDPSETSSSSVEPQIHNCWASADVGCALDTTTIANSLQNVEFNSQRSAVVTVGDLKLKTSTAIYASGKVVCKGAKSPQDCRKAVRKHIRSLQNLGINASLKSYKLSNIQATADAGFLINLLEMARAHALDAFYEPELFPGLRYTMRSPKVTLTIFMSGKINIVGAKQEKDVRTAFHTILPILRQFKKGGSPAPAPAPAAAAPQGQPQLAAPTPQQLGGASWAELLSDLTLPAPAPAPAAPTAAPSGAEVQQPSASSTGYWGLPSWQQPQPSQHYELPPPSPSYTHTYHQTYQADCLNQEQAMQGQSMLPQPCQGPTPSPQYYELPPPSPCARDTHQAFDFLEQDGLWVGLVTGF